MDSAVTPDYHKVLGVGGESKVSGVGVRYTPALTLRRYDIRARYDTRGEYDGSYHAVFVGLQIVAEFSSANAKVVKKYVYNIC